MIGKMLQRQIETLANLHDGLEVDVDQTILQFGQRRGSDPSLAGEILQGPVVLATYLSHTLPEIWSLA